MAHTQQCRAVQYQAVEGGGVKSYRSTFESRACMWSEKEKTIIWEAKSDYQAPGKQGNQCQESPTRSSDEQYIKGPCIDGG
jgi:hypothetical protein